MQYYLFNSQYKSGAYVNMTNSMELNNAAEIRFNAILITLSQ